MFRNPSLSHSNHDPQSIDLTILRLVSERGRYRGGHAQSLFLIDETGQIEHVSGDVSTGVAGAVEDDERLRALDERRRFAAN